MSQNFFPDDLVKLRAEFDLFKGFVSDILGTIAPLVPAIQQTFSGQVAGVGRSDAMPAGVLNATRVGTFSNVPQKPVIVGGRPDH